MLIPTKHENLKKTTIIMGAAVVSYLKSRGSENIEVMFQFFRQKEGLSLNQYHDTLMMLWLGNIVNIREHRVHIN